MMRTLGIVVMALALSMGLLGSVALGVTLPSQANPRAVDATQNAPSGADATGHPDNEVNGVPPGPPTWLGESSPYGPPEWIDESGGPPTWLTTP